jgi:hypothetical protein
VSTFSACLISGTYDGVQTEFHYRSFAAMCLLDDVGWMYAHGVGRSYIFSRKCPIFAFLSFFPSFYSLTPPASIAEHNCLETCRQSAQRLDAESSRVQRDEQNSAFMKKQQRRGVERRPQTNCTTHTTKQCRSAHKNPCQMSVPAFFLSHFAALSRFTAPDPRIFPYGLPNLTPLFSYFGDSRMSWLFSCLLVFFLPTK